MGKRKIRKIAFFINDSLDFEVDFNRKFQPKRKKATESIKLICFKGNPIP